MADIVTLKDLCEELKLDPREARERLRAAASDAKTNPELAKARKPRAPWQWVKGSKALEEAKKVLKEQKKIISPLVHPQLETGIKIKKPAGFECRLA